MGNLIDGQRLQISSFQLRGRSGCSSSIGHQRATHVRVKCPRAQAPDWHQAGESGSYSSPSGHPGLSRVCLACSSLQCPSLAAGAEEADFCSSYLGPLSAFPGDTGVSSPVLSQSRGATWLRSHSAVSFAIPPHWLSTSTCFPTGGSILSPR